MPSRPPALLPVLLALGLSGTACTGPSPAAANRADTAWMRDLDAYGVVWTTPSGNSADSMPLSGHNLGLNVWVEGNDVCILMGGPNCMDENGMQVKLGMARITLPEGAFAKDFKQTLRLRHGEITIDGRNASGADIRVFLWCDADRPVVHLSVSSSSPVDAKVSYETWSGYQAKVEDGHVRFVRRLAETNQRRLRDAKAQGMEAFLDKIPDPLSKLTCGGRIDGRDLVDAGQSEGRFNGMRTEVRTMKTAKPADRLDLAITLRMEQDPSLEAWETALARTATHALDNDRQALRENDLRWEEFWNRSHIAIKRNPAVKEEDDKPWQAARNYNLVRYMLASNASGRAMTLFNGGNFACTGNPDGRNWDGCQFMAQNQRLVYWPMLRSGDFDMLKVAGDFYLARTEMNNLHARKFWGIEDSVAYTEPFGIFGLDAIGTNAEGRSSPAHLRYHHTSGMEFALMMLEAESYGGARIPGYRGPALGILHYYDNFYQKRLREKTGKPLDENGKLVIYPSDACEPYHGCTNNTDVVAGLRALSRALLAEPDLAPAQREFIGDFSRRIPDFAMETTKDGKTFFRAAKSWENVFFNGNMDFPQMYILFPFGELSPGRSDMELAKNTWKYSAINEPIQHQNQCWYQTAINFARMGDTENAAKHTTEKLLFESKRFPVFYHTHYAGGRGEFCHVPDTDHGGVAMTALQEMLMQADGDRILLGPAWPKAWDCHFKLHAPKATTVEGRVEAGKVVVEKVEPAARRKDVEIFPLK